VREAFYYRSLRRAVVVMFVYAAASAASAIAMWPCSTILAGVWVIITVIAIGSAVIWACSLRGWGDDG
jgi:hypothetical protein